MAQGRNRKALITIRDVAKESRCSATTVSIVLNDAPLARYIPISTKDRIERTAKRLGYRPKVVARYVRSKRNHTIGIMVFDLLDPFCNLVLRGIENSLYQASYLPVFTDAQNQRSRFERYLEILLDRRVEGLIVVANWLFVDINLLADIEKHNVPAAVIGRELQTETLSSVLVDNEAGARLAMEHLYSLGHRKIAIIRGPKMLGDSVPRWRGMQEFARSVKLELEPRLIADLPDSFDPNSGFAGGYTLTTAMIRSRLRFTALLAFDDMTAFGAIRALEKAGIRVPEECSVMGFDDVPPAGLSVPALTTVRQPMEAMGSTATGIVLEAINASLEGQEFTAVHRKMAPELVVRDSTRPRRGAGERRGEGSISA